MWCDEFLSQELAFKPAFGFAIRIVDMDIVYEIAMLQIILASQPVEQSPVGLAFQWMHSNQVGNSYFRGSVTERSVNVHATQFIFTKQP